MRDETLQVVQHQHHDNELDVENRLPVNDEGNFVKSEAAAVAVESEQADLTRIVAGNDEKMSTPKMKKYYVPAFCQIMHLTVPMDR